MSQNGNCAIFPALIRVYTLSFFLNNTFFNFDCCSLFEDES